MLITSFSPAAAVSFQAQKAPIESQAQPQATATPGESFQSSPKESTSPLLKAGKWALAAGATTGAGALGYYAGSQLGGAAGVAGAAIGGLVGAASLGSVGVFADLASGFFSSSNKTLPLTIAGGVLGAAAGGATGLLCSNSVAATVLAVAGGLSALALTGAATNILRD